jgi:hypothetical protein
MMRILSSRSSRFTRSVNHTTPEFRTTAPKAPKGRLSLLPPLGQDRTNVQTNSRRNPQG